MRAYESLKRRHIQGRDLYDLMLCLNDPDWPGPKFTLLRNALKQTGWDGPIRDEQNWRIILCQRLGKIDWKNAVADVKPFLERADEAELLTPGNFEKLLNCSVG